MESIDILVIDDMSEIIELVKTACEENPQIKIYRAPSGKQGLVMYDKVHPALVLCDYKMNNGNGLYFLNKVRKKDPSAKVIIMSSHQMESQALKKGAIAFIHKPFPIKGFSKTLLNYIQL